MGASDSLIAVSLGYVAFLFAVAAFADTRARAGRQRWLRSPAVYTLSLSIYCTAWTFYGAVGYAARSGLEFVTIYLGPTLLMIGWWGLLRRIVRIGRAQRITSVADMVSSRYGKSVPIGMLVTLIAVAGTAPYIALQLQSVTLSAAAFSGAPPEAAGTAAGWVAAGLALFTILFGTRSLDVDERHHGVVAAIAVEAVVKLVALVAVGLFVVVSLGGGPSAMLDRIAASSVAAEPIQPGRWTAILFLSGAAFLCLPRMFQVTVVENGDERNLATAAWAFPLYLLLMSLFVVPIAVIGLERLPQGSNPDLFVLTLPLMEGRDGLALLAFIGGFSSATSMVIVAAIALATMVSNHVVLPIWLKVREGGATVSGDVRAVTLLSRRLAIAAIVGLGWAYLAMSGGGKALAATGLISFVGVAQILPAMLGGVLWRGATRWGALAGLVTGAAIWAWTLFIPALGPAALPASLLTDGPFGLSWARPGAYPVIGGDPLVAAIIWSIGFNTFAFVCVSFATFPSTLERVQGAQFVHVLDSAVGPRAGAQGAAQAEDLLVMAQRILGTAQAHRLFAGEAERQDGEGYLPNITQGFIERLERELAGSVGAATAHAMLGQVGGGALTARELLAVADESAQLREYSARLEQQSDELRRTARQLREANEKLTRLGIQKDAFLGQVSHELRTPMTSIRAFSEILRTDGLTQEERARYAGIIHEEGARLTRLLDDLLEMSVLEAGRIAVEREPVVLRDVIERAVRAARPPDGGRLAIARDLSEEDVPLVTDPGRLAQVFINLISNAEKYCDAAEPTLRIAVRASGARVAIDFVDNGQGIAAEDRGVIFEKFSRLSDSASAGGAGLGLSICREIAARLDGSVDYVPGLGGSAFRVTLPLATPDALAAE